MIVLIEHLLSQLRGAPTLDRLSQEVKRSQGKPEQRWSWAPRAPPEHLPGAASSGPTRRDGRWLPWSSRGRCRALHTLCEGTGPSRTARSAGPWTCAATRSLR